MVYVVSGQLFSNITRKQGNLWHGIRAYIKSSSALWQNWSFFEGGGELLTGPLLPFIPYTQRQRAHPGTQEAPSKHQETFFHCEGDQALAQVAQGGDGFSILGDTQKLSGHGPRQLALCGPAWGKADQMTSRGSFQPQPLWDSVRALHCRHVMAIHSEGKRTL